MKIVVDTYAWIELFIGSRKGQAVKEKLGSAEEVCTPDAVLAELAGKFIREGLESNVVEERLFKASEVSKDSSHRQKHSDKSCRTRPRVEGEG